MKRVYTLIVISLIGWLAYGQATMHPMLVARSLVERGEYNRAQEILRNSPEAGLDYKYQLLSGEIYLLSGRYDSAALSFTKANLLNAFSGELGLAKIYARKGDSKLATQYLANHLKSEFREPLKVLMLDKNFQKIEDTDDWKQLWKSSWYTQLEEGVAEVEYILSRGGPLSDARNMAETFTGLYSERSESQYINGLILMADGKYEKAAEQLSLSINKDNSEINAWLALIDALGKSGNFLGASGKAMEAISLFPDRLQLYIIRVSWLRRAGDRELAINELESLLEYYPGSEELLNLAGNLAFETRRYNSALEYASENIDKHPGNPENYILRANVYLATRTWEFAINDYAMSLDLDPKNGDAYYNKAVALIGIDKTVDACHDLKMALKLGNKKASDLISRYCIR